MQLMKLPLGGIAKKPEHLPALILATVVNSGAGYLPKLQRRRYLRDPRILLKLAPLLASEPNPDLAQALKQRVIVALTLGHA